MDDLNLRSENGNGCPHYNGHENFCFSDGKDGCTGKKLCVDYNIYQLEEEVKSLFSKKNSVDGYEICPEFNSHFIKREDSKVGIWN